SVYTNLCVQHHHKQNPLQALISRIVPGEIQTATHLTQADSCSASAFYNEFARPQGWEDALGIGLLRSPNAAGGFKDRQMRFGWNLRNGTSSKRWRRI